MNVIELSYFQALREIDKTTTIRRRLHMLETRLIQDSSSVGTAYKA